MAFELGVVFLCPRYHGGGWVWGKLLASSGSTEAREGAEQGQCTDRLSQQRLALLQMSIAGALNKSSLKSDICHMHYL